MNDKIDKKLTGKGISFAHRWIQFFRGFWWVVAGLVILVVGGFFIAGQLSGPNVILPDKKTQTGEPDTAQMILRKISHTATRNGKAEWNVSADSGWYEPKNKTTVLNRVAVTFFQEGDSTLRISAEDGVLENETENLQLGGEVKVERDDVTLITKGATYEHSSHIVTSNSPVEVSSPMFVLTGNVGKMNMENHHATLTGNVRAKIYTGDQGL